RAPLPVTTSIPVPKQKEQTEGSDMVGETRGCGELLSSALGTTTNLWALEPLDTGEFSSQFPSLLSPAESKAFALSRTRPASSGSRNPPASVLISDNVKSIDCPLVSSIATQTPAMSVISSDASRCGLGGV